MCNSLLLFLLLASTLYELSLYQKMYCVATPPENYGWGVGGDPCPKVCCWVWSDSCRCVRGVSGRGAAEEKNEEPWKWPPEGMSARWQGRYAAHLGEEFKFINFTETVAERLVILYPVHALVVLCGSKKNTSELCSFHQIRYFLYFDWNRVVYTRIKMPSLYH